MKLLEYQIHSSVAKLLAKENITVSHGNYETASFDVKNRVLLLPMWKDKGKVFYDMMIAHEVGHALYTPVDVISQVDPRYFSVLNIIEDIRIEKLIQRQYAGLPKVFNGAYKKAVEEDFFGIGNRDVADLPFIDRLNLKGKCRHHLEVPMDEYEASILDRCQNAETIDEVMELYHEIVGYMKKTQDESKENDDAKGSPEKSNEGNTSIPSNEQGDPSELDGNEESDEESDEDTSGDANDDGTESDSISSDDEEESSNGSVSLNVVAGEDAASVATTESLEIRSQTQDAFNVMSQEILDDKERKLSSIFMWPTEEMCDEKLIGYHQLLAERDAMQYHRDASHANSEKLSEFHEYMKNLKKKVTTLIHEFNRKKSAWEYARAQSAKTGMLDVNRLHSYKYDDQIFKSITQLAQSKNHGMILYVDYSASMRSTLGSVIDQILNLVYFCQRVGIPFEVYGFTSFFNTSDNSMINTADMGGLRLTHLLSSQMTKSEIDKAFFQLFCQKSSYRGYVNNDALSRFEELGGTPLNLTTMVAYHHIKSFLKRNRVQKTNVIFLTDGESARLSVKNSARFLEFPLGNKVYKIDTWGSTIKQQTQLLEILKGTLGINLICIRIASHKAEVKRDLLSRMMYDEKHLREFNKNGFFNFEPKEGYNFYSIISAGSTEINDSDFTFNTTDDQLLSSKKEQTKLANAFTKHFSSQKNQRVLLRKFAEIIA